MLLMNILLAAAWVALSGQFTPTNVVLGFVLGYIILWLAPRPSSSIRYFVHARRVISFTLFFLKELFLANLRIMHDVLTPTHHMKPAIVAIPLDAKTDAEIALLANLITLTPGTLSLDVSDDRKVLYIHATYVDDADLDRVRRDIKEGFERRVMELLR